MYKTPVDEVVKSIKNNIYNHKHIRPQVKYQGIIMRHLLMPKLQLYAFRFLFDSVIVNSNDGPIDEICKNKYGNSYVYPFIILVNNIKGLQDLYNVDFDYILPNEINDFFVECKKEYDNNIEEEVEVILDTESSTTSTSTTSTNIDFADYLKQVFGNLFVS